MHFFESTIGVGSVNGQNKRKTVKTILNYCVRIVQLNHSMSLHSSNIGFNWNEFKRNEWMEEYKNLLLKFDAEHQHKKTRLNYSMGYVRQSKLSSFLLFFFFFKCISIQPLMNERPSSWLKMLRQNDKKVSSAHTRVYWYVLKCSISNFRSLTTCLAW